MEAHKSEAAAAQGITKKSPILAWLADVLGWIACYFVLAIILIALSWNPFT